MMIMLGVAGMVMDYGIAAVQEARLQKSTDAAALAGIQDLPLQEVAKTRMVEYFNTNYTYNTRATATYGTDAETCWVSAVDPVPTFFMSLFGIDELYANARSKAKLQVVTSSKGLGVMPFVLLNPNSNWCPGDDLEDGRADLNNDGDIANNVGRDYILKYGEDSMMVDDWYGCEQILDPTHLHDPDSDGIDLSNGGWRTPLALDPNSTDPYSDANSADAFRTNIEGGWDGYMNIGDILDSNPGVMTGATTQGRRNRLAGSTTTYEQIIADREYDYVHFVNDPRLIVVPIVSLGKYGVGNDGLQSWQVASQNEIENESYDWMHSRVDGFALFYMWDDHEQKDESIVPGGSLTDTKWITGRFLGFANIGGSGAPGDEDPDADFGLRYGRLIPW
jgi:hypothetical protein